MRSEAHDRTCLLHRAYYLAGRTRSTDGASRHRPKELTVLLAG